MIPDPIWPAIVVGCLALVGWWDARRITRRAERYRSAEVERMARKASAPLGNVRRIR